MVKTRGIRVNVVHMKADAKMNKEIQAKKVRAAGQLYVYAKRVERKVTYARAAQAMGLDASLWDCVRKSIEKQENVLDMNKRSVEDMEEILKRLEDEDNKSEVMFRQEMANKAAEMYCEAYATPEPLTLKLAATICGLDSDGQMMSPDVQLVSRRVRELKKMILQKEVVDEEICPTTTFLESGVEAAHLESDDDDDESNHTHTHIGGDEDQSMDHSTDDTNTDMEVSNHHDSLNIDDTDTDAEVNTHHHDCYNIDNLMCKKCGLGDDEPNFIVCSDCDVVGMHVYCFRPKLPAVPSDDWFCPGCDDVKKRKDNINKEKENEDVQIRNNKRPQRKNTLTINYNETYLSNVNIIKSTPTVYETDGGLKCTECDEDDDAHKLVSCCVENCGKTYHLYCLQPKLSCMPRKNSKWYCPECLLKKHTTLPLKLYDPSHIFQELLKGKNITPDGNSMDIFAGCGVGAKVMTEEGFHCIMACEKDDSCQRILRSVLHKHTPLLPDMKYWEAAGFPRKVAIMAIGLPCPGHSVVQQMQNEDGMNAMENEKSAEAYKFLYALSSTQEANRPDCLFLECTKGILQSPDEAGNKGGFHRFLNTSLNRLGYSTQWLVSKSSGDNAMTGPRWIMVANKPELDPEMQGFLRNGMKTTWDGEADDNCWGLDRNDAGYPATCGRFGCPRAKNSGTSLLYMDEKGQMCVAELEIEAIAELFGVSMQHLSFTTGDCSPITHKNISKSKQFEIIGNASRYSVMSALRLTCRTLAKALVAKKAREDGEIVVSAQKEIPRGAVEWNESNKNPTAGFSYHTNNVDEEPKIYCYEPADDGRVTNYYPNVEEFREKRSAREFIAKALSEEKAKKWSEDDVRLYLAKSGSGRGPKGIPQNHLLDLSKCIHQECDLKLPCDEEGEKLNVTVEMASTNGRRKFKRGVLEGNGRGGHTLCFDKSNHHPVFAVLLFKKGKKIDDGVLYGEGFGGEEIIKPTNNGKKSWQTATFNIAR